MLWMLLSAFVVFKPYPPALESGVLKPYTPPPPQNMGYSSPLHSCIRKFSAQAPPALPRDGVSGCFDLPEEFLGIVVIEWELSIDHCVEQHSHGPHITGLATVWLTCRERTSH